MKVSNIKEAADMPMNSSKVMKFFRERCLEDEGAHKIETATPISPPLSRLR